MAAAVPPAIADEAPVAPGQLPRFLPGAPRRHLLPSDVMCSRPAQGRILGVVGLGPDLFLAGDAGVLRSTDGGKTFAAADLHRACGMYRLWAKGEDVFGVGQGGSVVRSADHGRSWEQQISGTGDDLSGIWGASADDLWVVAEHGFVLRSRDRGKTWTDRQLAANVDGYPQSIGELWGPGPGTRDVLFAGRRGLVARSRDGGATFTVEATGVTDVTLTGVFGTSADDVWAFGDALLLHATAPGRWTEVKRASHVSLTGGFAIGQSVVLTTSSGDVEVSRDGGKTFATVTVAAGDVTLTGVWGDGKRLYVTETDGPGDMSSFEVNGGGVFESSDGGLHWTKLWAQPARGRRQAIP